MISAASGCFLNDVLMVRLGRNFKVTGNRSPFSFVRMIFVWLR